jgi:hypothetical protein
MRAVILPLLGEVILAAASTQAASPKPGFTKRNQPLLRLEAGARFDAEAQSRGGDVEHDKALEPDHAPEAVTDTAANLTLCAMDPQGPANMLDSVRELNAPLLWVANMSIRNGTESEA